MLSSLIYNPDLHEAHGNQTNFTSWTTSLFSIQGKQATEGYSRHKYVRCDAAPPTSRGRPSIH